MNPARGARVRVVAGGAGTRVAGSEREDIDAQRCHVVETTIWGR
jgi:hypothetical protein